MAIPLYVVVMWENLNLKAGCIALALLLMACGDDGADERSGEPQPPSILPYAVELEEDNRNVQAVGTARARVAAAVRADTAGVVEEVLFSAGDLVEKGQPLLRLESEDERLALNLTRVAVREAEQLLERYRRIENTGAVSDSAISEARTQLEAAQINLEQAQLRLAEQTVTAPFDGFMGLTDIDPGARVTPELEIAVIDDRRVLFIDFNVPEDVFGQLTPGDAVDVTAFAEGDRTRTAEVISLDNRVDPDSRSFRVRASLDNAEDALRPGMSFEVRFAVPGRRYPVVPEAAIVWGADGAYLWAVRDDAAVEVPVQIVSRRDGRVLVDAALVEGDIIVAEGVQKMRDGIPVVFEKPLNRTGPAVGAASSGSSGQ